MGVYVGVFLMCVVVSVVNSCTGRGQCLLRKGGCRGRGGADGEMGTPRQPGLCHLVCYRNHCLTLPKKYGLCHSHANNFKPWGKGLPSIENRLRMICLLNESPA